MGKLLITILLVSGLQMAASARLAETPEQCKQRYGTHIKEIPGHGLVDFCRIYEKQNIKISAVFVNGRTAPKVGCILYSTHRSEGSWLTKRTLTEEEQDGLLATVPGKWRLPSASPAPTLRGGGPVRELTVKPNSIGDSRMRESREAVRTTLDTLYPGLPGRTIEELGRNSPDKYAFAFHGGMGITHYKVSDAIIEWSKAIKAQRAEERKPDPKDLKGF